MEALWSGSASSPRCLEKVHELMNVEGAAPVQISVVTPYKQHAESMNDYSDSCGCKVRCYTIHSFNERECDYVIASMVAGIQFMDQDTLINSIVSRSQLRLSVIMSRFYQLLPPRHSMARFLAFYPKQGMRKSVQLSPERIRFGLEVTNEAGRQAMVSSRLLITNEDVVREEVSSDAIDQNKRTQFQR